jgi:hypothetical protein
MWRRLSKISTGIALGAFGTLILLLLALTVGGAIVLFCWLHG